MPQVPALREATLPEPARRPKAFWGRLLEPFFSRIRVDQEAVDRLKEAYGKGLVVHVFRAHRVLDPLFVLFALGRLGLQAPRWLHDHFSSQLPSGASDLAAALGRGEPALLFLRRARTLISPNTAFSESHVEALLQLQRQTEKPILLLPETLLWAKQKSGLRRTIIDAIFGDRENPGRMREILGFFWHHKSSRYHVGAPIDLQAVLAREKNTADRVIAKKIRWALLHHLSREEELRTGPVGRSAARTRQMVLNDPTLRAKLPMLAKSGEDLPELEKRADAVLRTIAADMRYGWLRVLDAIVDYIWSKIYDGIAVDAEGFQRLRRAARRGPVVLVPSHKSHIDYLVLSQVFFKDGLMPPHIAAGDNLNFWPMGHIFRRSGAFFLRRGFKGDKLYAMVFAAYVRRLLKEGHAVEFFIEGGRSRTGKLLAARTGMLAMCVDPVLDGTISDLSFVPVSIGYEKIVEGGTYTKELSGAEKKKEDVGALVSATSVLRSKYGRVYVDFAEPISLRVFAASRGMDLAKLATGDLEVEPLPEKKQLVVQLGHRIINGINEVTRVTPTSAAALVLLAQPRKGLAEAELYRLADRSIDFLTRVGARISAPLSPTTRQAALREALGRFAAEGLLSMIPAPDGETIYQVNDDGRRALDYYKNNILHFFVPYAIVCTAVLAQGDRPVAEIARRVSQLLKFEFSFRVEQAFEENFRQATELLVQRRIIEVEGDRYTVTTNGLVEAKNLAGLISVFFEAYRLAAETLEEIKEPTPQKKFLPLALGRARRQILEGRIQRAEAASQLTLQAALQLLSELGVTKKSGEVELADEAKRVALIEELSAYLKGPAKED